MSAPAGARQVEWRNWLGNQRCRSTWLEPDGPEALAAGVASAAARGPLRCVGRGTAWSGLVVTDGTLVSTARLTRILELRLDDAEPTVLVESGITIRALSRVLAARGFMLIGVPMFRDVSVGGALATGTHGCGFESGAVADAVTELTIVDAGGRLHRFDRTQSAALALAKVSLGMLGAVYSVRLRVQPTFSVWIDEFGWPLADVVDGLSDLCRTYDFAHFFWFPQAPSVVVRGMRRIDGPPRAIGRAEAVRHRLVGRSLHAAGATIQPLVAAFAPGAVPTVMRAAARTANARRSWMGNPHHEFHHREAVPPSWSMSFGLPMDQVAAAVEVAGDVARTRQKRHRDGPTFPFYARLVGASDAPLAAAYGRPTCYLESVLCRGTRDVPGYYADLEPRLHSLPGARPHWAKLLPNPDGALAGIAGLSDFRALRDSLDPHHSFTNDLCRRLLA